MSQQSESELVERVFLRIGMAESDNSLEQCLDRFLTPTILKLASPYEEVRNKVLELLSHVSKRVKSRPAVKLPVDALLTTLQDPQSGAFVTNFSLVYIRLGVPRLSPEKRAALLPSLLACLPGRPHAQQLSLLGICIPILPDVKMPPTFGEEAAKPKLGITPELHPILLPYLLNYLLIPYSSSAAPDFCPPGLSPQDWKQLPHDSPTLEQEKMGILKLLGSGVLPGAAIVPHLVVGSADTHHSVANLAELEMKRFTDSTIWNDKHLVIKLFDLFLGYIPKKNVIADVATRRKPADIRLRLKLFPCFLRSNEASKQLTPQGIQVIFECLFGTETNPKLQSMALQYVINICNNCPMSNLTLFAKVLFTGLMKVASTFPEDKLVGLAYVALGLLVSKQPNNLCTDPTCDIIGVIKNLFVKLESCGPELKLSLRECLNLCGKAMRICLPPDQLLVLETVVLSQWCSPHPAVRQATVHYSHAVFPRSHIPSKYSLIMATADGMDEIRKEAVKALQQSETATKEEEPDLVSLMIYIQDKFACLDSRDKLPIPQEAYLQMVHYLRQVLVSQAGLPQDLREEKIHIDQAPYVSRYVTSLLNKNAISKEAVFLYLGFINTILGVVTDGNCCQYLLELVCGIPDLVTPTCLPYLPQYQAMMGAAREEVRDVGAQLSAALLCHSGQADKMATLLQEYPSKVLEAKHGTLLALGFGASYQLQNNDGSLPPSWLSEAVDLIYQELGSSTLLLSSGACLAISEISRSGPLPVHRDTVVDKLAGLVPKAVKKERPIQALGNLCIGDPQYGYSMPVMKQLISKPISELSDLDTHFTVGEALTCAILGPSHPLVRNKWTTEEVAFKPRSEVQVEEEQVTWLVQQILEHIVHSNPVVRQSAAVWLLALLKRCGNLAPVRKELEAIQQGFLNLLADSNELTQDMASKGLGALYELSEESQREQLVTFLVEALTSGRKSNVAVSDNTQIFRDDALGKAPEGGSLTTYKELCALATDLNQPDLVYKFLHLSNHHSIWNSRKGAAFGFGSIASQAKDQLAPYLSQIVPKIYRYQFDPNMAIRESFSSIWTAVVPEPSKAAETYFHEIMKDLLSNLTNPQWRVRESSCLAVKELLRTHPLVDFKDYLVPLWEILFRVRDDIKETVRKAADSTLTSLSNNTVKLCDSDTGSKAMEEILALVIPCLVQRGLQSTVAEVKAIGLNTLMQISKKSGGPLLKPHLPLLAQSLLEALGNVESQALNYISLRQETQQAQEKVDSARMSAYRSSPMMTILVHLVQFVDGEVLKELVPHILDLLKSSVALGTKAGCSYFVIQLVTHCSQDLQPFTGKLLSAFMNGLGDRNVALKKSYASTIGHLVRVAKDSSIEKLLTRLQAWYFEKEDLRLICGYTLQAIGRYSSDRLKDHAAKALPLAFFAMNNPDSKNEAQPWEEVWLEFTPGAETGLQLYQTEVVALCQLGLEDQSWGVKRQAAVTLGLLAERRGTGLRDQAPQLLDSLLQALMASRRTWDGKEYLLQAMTKLVLKCMQEEKYKDTIAKVSQILLEECQKNKQPYKDEAIRSLGLIAETTHIPAIFSSLFDILRPLLLEKDTNKEDSDDENDNRRASSRMSLRSVCLQSLGRAWPSEDRTTQELLRADWCALLESTFHSATWQLQLEVLAAALLTISRLEVTEDYPNTPELLKVTQPLTAIIAEALANKKYSGIRLKALEFAIKLLNVLKDQTRSDVWGTVKDTLRGPSQQLTEDPVPQIKDKASQLIALCCK